MNVTTKLYSYMQAVRATAGTDERGAGLAEYALLLVLIAVACVLAITALGDTIFAVFNEITEKLGGTPAIKP